MLRSFSAVSPSSRRLGYFSVLGHIGQFLGSFLREFSLDTDLINITSEARALLSPWQGKYVGHRCLPMCTNILIFLKSARNRVSRYFPLTIGVHSPELGQLARFPTVSAGTVLPFRLRLCEMSHISLDRCACGNAKDIARRAGNSPLSGPTTKFGLVSA